MNRFIRRILPFAAALSVGCVGDADERADSPAGSRLAPAAPATAGVTDAAAMAAADRASATSAASSAQVTVYKTPTCGCCSDWVDHLRENGFSVVAHDLEDLAPIKAEHGIRREFESCHTALVGGYVVEGHVPADLVARLLTERPAVAGIAVPGMPIGSPGMEGPYRQRYDILTFDRDGRTTVFARR